MKETPEDKREIPESLPAYHRMDLNISKIISDKFELYLIQIFRPYPIFTVDGDILRSMPIYCGRCQYIAVDANILRSMSIKQPWVAINRPSMPIKQPPVAINRPSTAIIQPSMPIKQPPVAINRPSMPIILPSTAIIRPTMPSAEPGAPPAKAERASAGSGNSTLYSSISSTYAPSSGRAINELSWT